MNRNNRKEPVNTASMHRQARGCAYRHLYHMMPPQGWMNDPNGFVYWRGQYHLFYQYYPDAPRWDLMHWGHCVSEDLIHWRHLPVALAPDRPYDANGCFSGSSIVHEDKLYLFYTGNDARGRQTQCMAVSGDGVRFEKYKRNPVVAHPPGSVNPLQFRDPCVFRRDNRFFMIVGAESTARRGQAIVYVSDTLKDWAYLHSLVSEDASMGYMWECPDLFFLEDQAVLMLSPQGITGRPQFNTNHDSGYFAGKFDAETGAFTHGPFQKLDDGFDFYAPQTAENGAGQCIMAAWMSNWATPTPTAAHQWAGSMILPREVRLSGGKLHFRPVRDIGRYLSLVTTASDVACDTLLPLQGAACRLEILSESADFTVRLFCAPDETEYTALSYNAKRRKLTLDLSKSGEDARGTRSLTLGDVPETLRLDIYLDRSSIEVFIGDGEHVMTARVFPRAYADGIRFAGGAVFRRISLWEFAAPENTND